MTKVKICGMMREEDLDLAKEADYLGFVVESGTRRSLTPHRARDLMQMSDKKNVAVITSQDPESIKRLVDILDPDVLQLHSTISADVIQEISSVECRHIWALIPVGGGMEVERAQELRHMVQGLLLDSFTTVPGGSGIGHDWNLSRELRDQVHPLPVVLSGGIRPENVAGAISKVSPEVIDVSSGVESWGTKNGTLINQLIDAVGRV